MPPSFWQGELDRDNHAAPGVTYGPAWMLSVLVKTFPTLERIGAIKPDLHRIANARADRCKGWWRHENKGRAHGARP